MIVRWCDMVGQAAVWTTPTGSLGAISNYLNLSAAANLAITVLSAADPNGNPVSYVIISGALPPGLQVSASSLSIY